MPAVPRDPKNPLTETVAARVSPRQLRGLRKAADQRGVRIGDVIRAAVDRELKAAR